jgi:hypothetical protein
VTFLHNFVSFRDFYMQNVKAIFQTGELFLDQRSYDLCLIVGDISKHAGIAHLSGMHLLYCDCIRKITNEKMSIAAAVTNGDSDNLMIGRNGIFYDRKGRDWDATIVKIIDNPISIRQAFWSPYKRLSRMINEQVEKIAAIRDKESHEKTAAGIADIANAAQTAPGAKPPAPPFDAGKFAGIFAAIGLAIGAIGTAIASIVTGFMNLSWWQMPMTFLGLLAAVSGPSMLIAWMKLRKRNLAPILDANGWAVNTRAKMNIPFGATLTHLAALPPGSERALKDPFAEKKRPWKLYIAIVVIAAAAIGFIWKQGYAKEWADKIMHRNERPATESVKSITVEGKKPEEASPN